MRTQFDCNRAKRESFSGEATWQVREADNPALPTIFAKQNIQPLGWMRTQFDCNRAKRESFPAKPPGRSAQWTIQPCPPLPAEALE
jgi:hypothetical protein